ncbi:MAG: 3-hydroxyacyl-CoA dehydrogenase family protein [Vicinamibacteria bacterium]
MADKKTVGVVGCGLMGSGIAQVCAEAGHSVIVREINDGALAKGLASIDKFLSKGVEKGKITAEKKAEVMGRIKGTTTFDDMAPCDIVIEAVIENIALKHETFQALNKVCGKDTIFASNTSSLSITEMAAGSGRADRFVGLHFFNPVPLMKLVEVVRAPLSSPDVVDAMCEFGAGIGKTVVRATDKPGFIVNRLLVPYMTDAIRALEQGVGTVTDIDDGMRLGAGYPMGPFALLDFVGLETTYYIANIMFDEFKETRYAPPTLLKRMVQAGMYGRKTGKGFYDYSTNPPTPTKGLV